MAVLITPTIVAREALMVLLNNFVFAGLVHRAYSQEFAKVGDTIRVRRPATMTASLWTSGWNPQPVTETSVLVRLDRHYDVSFEVTSKELSLDVVDFRQQFIEPAMRAHAQAIDALIASLYRDIPYYQTTTDTSEATKLADIANLRATMNNNKVPFDNRYCVVAPAREAQYLVIPSFLNAEKRGDTQALKEASLGRIFGMDWYMNQNIAVHTRGNITTAALARATVAGDVLELRVTSGTATVRYGDIIRITNTDGTRSEYVIRQDATIGTSFTPVAHYPPVAKAAAEATLHAVIDTDGLNNLAFHRHAFAFVTAPLAPPIGGAQAAVETYEGMSCRVVYDYDMASKSNRVSIDLLCGVTVLTPELAVRLLK